LIKFINKGIIDLNPYLRLIILSFFYALFWGIGIAGSGAEPGFGLPVPNIVAIFLMFNDRYYQGVINGFIILCVWWTIIFLFILMKHILKKRNSTNNNTQ
jgi:hypothetical protein